MIDSFLFLYDSFLFGCMWGLGVLVGRHGLIPRAGSSGHALRTAWIGSRGQANQGWFTSSVFSKLTSDTISGKLAPLDTALHNKCMQCMNLYMA